MLATVRVGVALSRPPRHDRDVFVVVSVDDDGDLDAADAEAQLLAAQVASAHPEVVMPVLTEILSVVL